MMVDMGDGVEKPVLAENDWIERMIQPEVLATIQRIGCSVEQDVAVVSDRSPKRVNYKNGYVDISIEGLTISIDDRQVNKLKYVKEKKIRIGDVYKKDPKTKKFIVKPTIDEIHHKPNPFDQGERVKAKPRYRVIAKERWLGYNNKTKTEFDLPYEFVSDNFSPKFLEQVKRHGREKGQPCWVDLPPGDSRKHSNESIPASDLPTPAVHYCQREGERTCLICSFASAVHYTGNAQLASEIYQSCMKVIDRADTMDRFLTKIARLHQSLASEHIVDANWDLLSTKDDDLVLAQIIGDDGKEDHVVTITRGWIFESNMDHALPLCKESLDLCCSSGPDLRNVYVGFAKAHSFKNYQQFVSRDNVPAARKKKKRRKPAKKKLLRHASCC